MLGKKIRTKPYTKAGIKRLLCQKCGLGRGWSQEKVGTIYRVLCLACDRKWI